MNGGIPLVSGAAQKRIIIEVLETTTPGQYQYRTKWENMGDDRFETLLAIVLGAASQVAHMWAQTSAKQAVEHAQRGIHLPVIVPPTIQH